MGVKANGGRVAARRARGGDVGEARGVELQWPGKRREDPTTATAAPSATAPRAKGSALRPVEWHRRAGLGASAAATGAVARDWQNRLIWGENLAAMRALLPELAGRVDLVYLDPPFATGVDFKYQADVGHQTAAELPGGVAARAYDDRWGSGRERWFSMLHERLQLVRALLSERGTLYLHLDWWAGHHARVLLDEVFGPENSLGEIVWAYGSPSGGRAAAQKLIKAHDILYVFARSYGRHRYKTVYLPYAEKYVRDWFKFTEPDGRRYRRRYRRDAEGRSYVEKQYLDASKGVPASTVWTDIQQVYADPRAYKKGMTSEVTGYPTQKPVRLLERILEISTEPGDLVADFCSGSGTALVAAERLGRRWIGCDEGALAIHTSRKRLLAEPRRADFAVARLAAEEDALDEGGRDEGTGALGSSGLELALRAKGRHVALWLEGIAEAALPREARAAKIERSLDWIDYWAVDWDYDGEVFRPSWIAHRTRKDRSLPQLAEHTYASAGQHRVAVMAADPFGNPMRWEAVARVG